MVCIFIIYIMFTHNIVSRRYCQGMGMIVASLLLFMDEEEVFWLTATIIEDLLPASYYSSTLLGMYRLVRFDRQNVMSAWYLLDCF